MTAFPRLLNADLTERARLVPLKLTMHQHLLTVSAADMTLPPDAPEISLRDLIELHDEQGSCGVYRVTAVERDAATRRVSLMHGISSLGDSLIELLDFTGTAADCMTRLLAHQQNGLWTLGTCDYPGSRMVHFEAEKEDVCSALYRFSSLLPEEYALTFDQFGGSWLVSLTRLDDAIACEARLSRNLHGLTIRQDAEPLCTRLYPYGAEMGPSRVNLLPLLYLPYRDSAAAADWGIISRTFTSDRITDAHSLLTVADKYLARHASPGVTVEMDALDLSAITGEPLDRFTLGARCRLALPSWQRTIESRVTDIRHDDLYGEPGHVRVTLRSHLRSGKAEWDSLIESAAADRLEGGALRTVSSTNRAEGTASSPIVHYFTVENGSQVLDVQFSFVPDEGVSVVDARIDDAYLPNELIYLQRFDGLTYMKRDTFGHPVNGQHRFILYPSTGVTGQVAAVSSTVAQRVITPQ